MGEESDEDVFASNDDDHEHEEELNDYEEVQQEEMEAGEEGAAECEVEGTAGAALTSKYSTAESLALVCEAKRVLVPSGRLRLRQRRMTIAGFWQEVQRGMAQRQWEGKPERWLRTWLSLHDRCMVMQDKFWHAQNKLDGFVLVKPGSRAATLSMTPAQRAAAGRRKELVRHSPPLVFANDEGPSSPPFYTMDTGRCPACHCPDSVQLAFFACLDGCIALSAVVHN